MSKKDLLKKQAAQQIDKHLKLNDDRGKKLDKGIGGASVSPAKKRDNDDAMSLSSGYNGEGAPFLKFDTAKYHMTSSEYDFKANQYKEKFYKNR